MLKQHCHDDPEMSVTGKPILEWPIRKVSDIFSSACIYTEFGPCRLCLY